MAMSLSTRHAEEPYVKLGMHTLGQYQFEQAKAWEEKGNLAIIGVGVEPGIEYYTHALFLFSLKYCRPL